MKKVLFNALIIVLCVAMTCCGRGVYTGAEPLVMMDGVESIPSEKGTGMVYNFHIIDDYTDERDTPTPPVGQNAKKIIASVTAPDGNTYLAYEDVTENVQDVSFELYIMSTSGWEKIAEAECDQIRYSFTYNNGYEPVDINILADNESNIYVLAYTALSLDIYKYNPDDGKMVIMDSMYISGDPRSICAETDGSDIYIAVLFKDFIDVARYNFEEEKVYQNDGVILKNIYADYNFHIKMAIDESAYIHLAVKFILYEWHNIVNY